MDETGRYGRYVGNFGGMSMKLKEIMSLMSCKDGDELFEKVVSILAQFDIEVIDSEGNDKSFYALLCEIAEVWNKEK